nr:unnamed protein product [Digitaria exilis]
MLGGLIGVRKGDWLNIDFLWVSDTPAYQNGRRRSPTQRLHPRAGGYGQLPGTSIL